MSSGQARKTKVQSAARALIAAMAAIVFSPAVAAQTPQQVLDALDADHSGAISKDEAVDDMKQNFSFIDANGDGGIDIDELTRILKMVESQRR